MAGDHSIATRSNSTLTLALQAGRGRGTTWGDPQCDSASAVRSGPHRPERNTMTFRENLAVLRDHWLIVLVTVALAMGASAARWALRPVQYTASLTLYVSAQ